MLLHYSITADPGRELFRGPGTSSVYSDFVKQAHERFRAIKKSLKINLLALKALFESESPECFHITGDDTSKPESYFCSWLLDFYIYLFYGPCKLCRP